MPNRESVFLETTAIIDVTFKYSAYRNAVLVKLKEFTGTRQSSMYVKAQVRNGFLAWLSNLGIRTLTSKSISDIHRYARTCTSQTYQRYKGNSYLDYFEYFVEQIEQKAVQATGTNIEDFGVKLFHSILNNLIIDGWDQIENGDLIDEYIDETNCYSNVFSPPERRGDYISVEIDKRCGSADQEFCKVNQFCDQKRDEFLKIRDKLIEAKRIKDDDDSKNEKTHKALVLRRIKKGHSAIHKSSECKSIDDEIIAIEAKSKNILNNNAIDFDLICEALGKNSCHYTIPKV